MSKHKITLIKSENKITGYLSSRKNCSFQTPGYTLSLFLEKICKQQKRPGQSLKVNNPRTPCITFHLVICGKLYIAYKYGKFNIILEGYLPQPNNKIQSLTNIFSPKINQKDTEISISKKTETRLGKETTQKSCLILKEKENQIIKVELALSDTSFI